MYFAARLTKFEQSMLQAEGVSAPMPAAPL